MLRVWEQRLAVYGADMVWDQLDKDGITVARCTVEPLMRDLGLAGPTCRSGAVSCSMSALPPRSRTSSSPLSGDQRSDVAGAVAVIAEVGRPETALRSM